MKIKGVIVIFLIVFSGVFYYHISEEKIILEELKVIRIIDGDTLELENNQKVRLLGINTPEKKKPFSKEATKYLEDKTLNKTISLENFGYDKYGRILGYIFIENENINEEILRQGLATLYYYEKDNYYNSLKNAEEKARQNEVNLWKKSKNSNCLEIKEFRYEERNERCKNDELLILENSCDYEINFILKDDATHIYEESIGANEVFEKSFSCIWNDDGDSVYIYDDEGLVLFFRY